MHDMNQALAILDLTHHWTLKSNNSNGRRRSYECTVWDAGRRVTGHGQTPLAAIARAMTKLKEPRRRKRRDKPSWVPVVVGSD